MPTEGVPVALCHHPTGSLDWFECSLHSCCTLTSTTLSHCFQGRQVPIPVKSLPSALFCFVQRMARHIIRIRLAIDLTDAMSNVFAALVYKVYSWLHHELFIRALYVMIKHHRLFGITRHYRNDFNSYSVFFYYFLLIRNVVKTKIVFFG